MGDYPADPQYPIDVSLLPPSWVATALGDAISDLHPGFASGSHNEDGVGVPHLRPMNIDRRGRLTLEELKYVPPTRDLRVVRGDVLFNNTNSPELVGKTAPIDLDGEWAFSNHMTRLRPPSGVSYRFLAYQLQYLWEEGYFRMRCTQHVNQASISARTLALTVPLILAPEQEQLRIVAELNHNLERLDSTVEVLKAVLRKLDDYRRGVLRQATSGSLVSTEAELARIENREYETGPDLLARIQEEIGERRSVGRQLQMEPIAISPRIRERIAKRGPQGFPEIGSLPVLPEGWTWARVRQVGQVTLGRQRAPKYHHGPQMRPYLRVANVFEDRIDASDVHQMNFTSQEYEIYALHRGDILLNEGQSPELVGRPAMFNDEVSGACFQNTLIRFRARPGVSSSFALLVFRDHLHTGRFRREAKWSTNIAHLGADRFASMEFPLPPLAEQERIVTEAKRCMTLADDLTVTVKRIVDRIGKVRHEALKRAFSGTLVAQAEDEEPASLLVQRIKAAHQTDHSADALRRRDRQVRRRPMQRRPLVQVLAEEGKRLTPEQLLQASGIGEDLIDDFYAELKSEEAAGLVRQEVEGGQVFLGIVEERD